MRWIFLLIPKTPDEEIMPVVFPLTFPILYDIVWIYYEYSMVII